MSVYPTIPSGQTPNLPVLIIAAVGTNRIPLELQLLERTLKMSKRKVSDARVVGVALGVVVITFVSVFLIHRSESLAASVTPSVKPATGLAFSPPLSEPLMSRPSSQEARSPGSGSYCGTVSLAYICRQLAIDTSPTQIAGLISDRGAGVSMLDLARGAKSLGLKARGIRTGLAGLKALSKPVIAFLPEAKHFLVVSKADDKGVTCIDLAGQNALAWYSLEEFAEKWNGEILTFDNTTRDLCSALSKTEMGQYVGGSCNSKCTKVIQEYQVLIPCDNTQHCGEALFVVLLKKYGCEATQQQSSCSENTQPSGATYGCKETDLPGVCAQDTSKPPTLWGELQACTP